MHQINFSLSPTSPRDALQAKCELSDNIIHLEQQQVCSCSVGVLVEAHEIEEAAQEHEGNNLTMNRLRLRDRGGSGTIPSIGSQRKNQEGILHYPQPQ
jgi:hypothetical protein